ncbi:MAG: esterase-like activity of phytase family protein, partial [Sulfurovum sp.]|nr:esterase-like activity of phytase family protein [Sulfurovum sp.]
MRIVFFFLIFLGSLNAGIFPVDITPSKKDHVFMGIKILDQRQLVFQNINDVKFSEISDLAYYPKNQKLFMISDEGKLFIFKAKFGDKIELLEPKDAVKLRKKNAKKFKKWRKDSEGLTLDNRGRLLISFEGRAKIGWFHKNSAQYGQMIKKYRLPKELQDPKNYRSRNKSLEALAWHPKYGVLTAAEWPLKKYHKKRQTVYALNGKKWHFKAEPEARSAISAMEVMDDGN